MGLTTSEKYIWPLITLITIIKNYIYFKKKATPPPPSRSEPNPVGQLKNAGYEKQVKMSVLSHGGLYTMGLSLSPPLPPSQTGVEGVGVVVGTVTGWSPRSSVGGASSGWGGLFFWASSFSVS